MLYLKCPNCKNILGNKQIPFEEMLKKICEDSKLTHDQKEVKKRELLDYFGLDKYCCRSQIISYAKLIEFVK